LTGLPDQPRTAAAARARSFRDASSGAAADTAPIRAQISPGMTLNMTQSLSHWLPEYIAGRG